jgi:hypothetical protein
MSISKWAGVQVAIGTLGSAVPIDALSKNNPGLVEYTGTDPSDGDYVALTNILGMHQVNNRIFRVDNEDTAGDDFDIEGENTTSYDTFVSGNFQLITFGTSLSTVTGSSASGGDFDFLDTTTIHDLVRSQIPNIANALTYTLDMQWDPSNAAMANLFQYSGLQTQVAARFTFVNSYKFLVLGYIGASGAPTGSAGEIVKTPAVFTAFGRPTYYTT